jgi:DNA invertase Pin-like site-specific DNA recombinase
VNPAGQKVDRPLRVVGYVRVSTAEQGDSGAGLEAQRRAIEAEAARRGWNLAEIYEDIASGRSVTKRPGLERALTALEGGGRSADALVVAKLDRLSRSLMDFSILMERSQRKGWALVALDLGVDTTTPSGEMLANVLAVFAHFERRLIGQRTKDALAVKRAQGVRLGRPPVLDVPLRRRIARMRRSGATFAAIAESLNAEAVPTAHGGVRWYPSTVRKVLQAA